MDGDYRKSELGEGAKQQEDKIGNAWLREAEREGG